jgi:hypothetical protein
MRNYATNVFHSFLDLGLCRPFQLCPIASMHVLQVCKQNTVMHFCVGMYFFSSFPNLRISLGRFIHWPGASLANQSLCDKQRDHPGTSTVMLQTGFILT